MRRSILLIALVLLFSTLATGVAASQELIDYQVRSLDSGGSLNLQQGYTVELQWIKGDLDAAGVLVTRDGSTVADMIMGSGETRSVPAGADPTVRVTLRNMTSGENGASARLEVQQYRDPDARYLEPVLSRSNLRVGSNEATDLSGGYSFKVAGEGPEGTELVLSKDSIPLERYSVEEGDFVVYRRTVQGEEFTVLIGEVSTVFQDTQGNTNVVFSTLNRFRPPESEDFLGGPATAFTAAMGVAGLLIIAFSFLFRRRS